MKKKLLVTAVLASLMLSGCGGGGSSGSSGSSGSGTSGSTPTGGGSTSSGGSTGSIAGKQLWMPYDTEQQSTTGTVSTISPIVLDNMDNPVQTVSLPVAPMPSGGTGLNSNSTQTTFALSSNNGSYQPQGSPFLFYAANGNVYSVDLTATTPSPAVMANLGLTQLCGMSAQQSDTTGVNGTLLVYGLTGSGATCWGTGMLTWAIPFNASNTTLQPLAFTPTVVDTAQSNGSVVAWLTQVGTSFYVTSNLAQQGTPVTGLSNVSSLSSLSSSANMMYEQASTGTVYAINPSTGAATAVTGIPAASSLSNQNVSTDGSGNIYFIDETNLANGSLAIDKIPAGATSALQLVTVTGMATSTNANGTFFPVFQVNSSGAGGLLTYVSSNGGTSGVPGYNLDFVNLGTASQTVNAILPNAYQGLFIGGTGNDGSMVVQGYSTTSGTSTSTSNSDIYLVNPGTGGIVQKFPGEFLVGQVVGAINLSSGGVAQQPVFTDLFMSPGPVTTTTTTTPMTCTVGATNAAGISSVSMVETTGYTNQGNVAVSGSGVCAITISAQTNPAGSLYMAGEPMTYSGTATATSWSLFAQAGISGAPTTIISSVTSPTIINSPGNGGSVGFGF